VLFVAWGYLDQPNAPPYFYTVVHALSLIVPTLFAAGLTALYAFRARNMAWPGKVGILLSLIASALGIAQGFVSAPVASWYAPYALAWCLVTLPHSLWVPVLPAGLFLAGVVGAVGERGVRGPGNLLIAMGTCGLGYYFTDSGSVFQARSVHVGFGLLYSLGWAALGFMLWAKGSSRPASTPKA
jgi:hypothetical protein